MCVKPSKLKTSSVPCIVLDNTPVVQMDEVKYLGVFLVNVFLVNDFREGAAIQREIRGIYTRGNVTINNFEQELLCRYKDIII